MSEIEALTREVLDSWATDPTGPVALSLKQRLLSVEAEHGEEQVIYPPTFADVGYNIDTLADGTKVALIDSVGSQANRLEPAFKPESGHLLANLVPQIEIVLGTEDCGQCAICVNEKRKKTDLCERPSKKTRSLFDLAHRAADAVVQASPTLGRYIADAFTELHNTGDAMSLATIAPTSLIFGCWDSRGGSGEKRPRLVRSIIRAWDVDQLHSAAQFNSIFKTLDEEQQKELKDAAKKKKVKLSNSGFADAPAVTTKDGRRVLGGIAVRGRIERHVTVNLVALRGVVGSTLDETTALRKYLLALSLLTATADIDMFLREGCNLRIADSEDAWTIVPRRGAKIPVDLCSDAAREKLREYAASVHKPFREAWEELELGGEHKFDLKTAKDMLGKSAEDD